MLFCSSLGTHFMPEPPSWPSECARRLVDCSTAGLGSCISQACEIAQNLCQGRLGTHSKAVKAL